MDLLYSSLVTVLGVLVLMWLATRVFLYVDGYVRPAREIVVGTFTTVGSGLPGDAAIAGKALGAKLERLKRLARTDPSGFGLIQTPVLVAVPDLVRERRSEAGKRLEALNLKPKDVDVNAVVKLIQSIYEPTRPTLEGTITDYGDRIEVRADLSWRSQILEGWSVSRSKPTGDNAAQVLNELYDDLLFQMIYDIPRNKKMQWWQAPEGESNMPNWQTLEAMTLGLESLEEYERTLSYDDLTRALSYLQRIPIHAPDYALGHYFFGIALGEDRNEERAASVFAQLEGMQGASQKLKWVARFQRAAAMLRQYSGPLAQSAAQNLLEPLITELREAGRNQDDCGSFARRLLPLSEAQLAYTYGTLFTLKTEIEKPRLKQWTEEVAATAETDYNAVTEWPSERERKDALSWLRNTKGYSLFRIAQWELATSTKPQAERMKDFREACNRALTLLQEANRERPNHYEILQNEAMILDDESYDPDGEFLSEAQSLYERTAQFVPRDYYQYERLARIYWRRASKQPATVLRRDLLVKGLEQVKKAQENRDGKSRTGALCGAYFNIALASGETDAAKKKDAVQNAIQEAKLSLQLNAQKELDKKPIADDTAKLMHEMSETLDVSDSNKQTLKDLAERLKG